VGPVDDIAIPAMVALISTTRNHSKIPFFHQKKIRGKLLFPGDKQDII
jgi:hypothetical protein